MTKTILILHGWGGNPTRWQNVVTELTKNGYRVLAPFVPGFDPRHPLVQPWDMGDYLAWLKRYLARHNITSTSIVGHSNGGRIALAFSANYPKLVSRLVLVGSAGLPPKNSLKKTIFIPLAKIGKVVFSSTLLKPLAPTGQKLLYQLAREHDYYTASPVMQKTMQNMLALNLTHQATQITVPTLLLWGANDSYTPLWMGKKLHQLIPNSRLEIIPHARHGPHLTNPQTISQFIDHFVSLPSLTSYNE